MKKISCVGCKKHKKGPLKVFSYRKKIGKNSKNVVEYYCTECFAGKEMERSQDANREKERIIKRQAIKAMQRRSRKVR